MSITSTGYQAPATERVGLIPSVYDSVVTVGSGETPILNLIDNSIVKGIEHSWITDKLGDPKKNANLEISDFAHDGKSTKQKTTNAVQIFINNVQVSKTMTAVSTYGGKELEHEVAKKAKEHAKDMEYSLFGLGRDANVKTSVFKAPTIRTDAVAGEMAGFFYYLAKGDTSFSNGLRGNVRAFDDSGAWGAEEIGVNGYKVLDENTLMEILQPIWDAGETPEDVFVGASLKKAINKIATRQFGNEKHVNASVVSLDTDFGIVNFRLHRYLSAKYGLDDVVFAGNFEYAKNGLLIPTDLEDVVTSKTAKSKRYYTEGCLEVRSADAFSIGVGLRA